MGYLDICTCFYIQWVVGFNWCFKWWSCTLVTLLWKVSSLLVANLRLGHATDALGQLVTNAMMRKKLLQLSKVKSFLLTSMSLSGVLTFISRSRLWGQFGMGDWKKKDARSNNATRKCIVSHTFFTEKNPGPPWICSTRPYEMWWYPRAWRKFPRP